MDTQMVVILVLVVAFLIVLGGLYSACEMAFSSANRIRLKNWAEEGNKGSEKTARLIEQYDRTLTTIVIANNIVYILITTLISIILSYFFGDNIAAMVLVSVLLTSTIILVFGELFPKSYARENADKVSLWLTNLVLFTRFILYPVVSIFQMINRVLKKRVGSGSNALEEDVSKEILTLIDEQSDDVINKQEKELVRNAMEFDDISVEEIQKPRVDIVGVDVTMPKKEILAILKSQKFSRIPVYDDNIDNVLGILGEREFLQKWISDKDFNLKKILRKPLFVPGSMKIAKLLPELQKSQVHMAMVMDESGGVQGIITMEDILEELVGEIWDEHDSIEEGIVKVNKNTYEVLGDVLVSDFFNEVNYKIDGTTESTTMAGLIQEKVQKMPRKNQEYDFDDFKMTATEIAKRRIKKLKVVLKNSSRSQG